MNTQQIQTALSGNINDVNLKNIYFLGIGGIGMSAIARYFKAKGFNVAGYDRTQSPLCIELETEGISVNYTEDVAAIPTDFLDKASTMIVRTPAVPEEQKQYVYFRQQGFDIKKRAEVLGHITRQSCGLCIAGTHGKTTTSTILAHLLFQSEVECNAFLGGISNNYGTNLLLAPNSNLVVIEADEFDRSFHQLSPFMAIITSTDADHLDIYGDEAGYREGFEVFTSLIRPNGVLIMHKGVDIEPRLQKGVKFYSYSETEGDFHAENIRIGGGEIIFDFVTPTEKIKDMRLGVPIKINIENSVAAMAIAWLNGVSTNELRSGLSSYSGIYRRFNILVKNEHVTLIDDYAHHPTELHASISSIKALYPDKKITGVFQPHLYSRTRDFADGFAHELSLLDNVILLPIYPARELPIEGVSSDMLLDKIKCQNKILCSKENLVTLLANRQDEVIITLGAGNIDAIVPHIKDMLLQKYKA